MNSVEAHYEDLLSDVYSWMFGGMDAGVERNRDFFRERRIRVRGSGRAVDLGAGCGFQSIPLAELGFAVVAVDFSEKLLSELAAQSGHLPITTVRGDLMGFADHIDGAAELIVCMQDTLLHLESKEQLTRLFETVQASLEARGRFVVTFRDLSTELFDLDRFIPLRSDENRILTCFLEYEPESVKVHDLVYSRADGGWSLSKSYYRKLRVSPDWVREALVGAGFPSVDVSDDGGMVTIVAEKA